MPDSTLPTHSSSMMPLPSMESLPPMPQLHPIVPLHPIAHVIDVGEAAPPRVDRGLVIYVLVIIIQIIAAILPIAAKQALSHEDLHPTVFTLWRGVLASITLTLFTVCTGDWRTVRDHRSWTLAAQILALAVLEPVIDQNLLYRGLQNSGPTFSQLISMIQPALTVSLGLFFRLELLDCRRLWGKGKALSILLALGAGVIALMLGSTQTGPEDSISAFARQCVAVLASASYSLLLDKTLQQCKALFAIPALINLFGAGINALMAVYLFKIPPFRFVSNAHPFLFAIFYAGILVSSFGALLTTYVVSKRGAVFQGAFSPISLFFGMMLTLLVFHQKPGPASIGAMIVLSVSQLILVWSKKTEEREKKTRAD